MNTINKVLVFLVGLMVGYWLGYFIGLWAGKKNCRILRKVEYVHLRDTIITKIPVPKVVVRQVPAHVDTAAILAAHFQEVHYLDTVQTGSVLFSIADVVRENRLVDRVIKVDGRVPVIYRNSLVMSAYMGNHACSVLAGIRHKSLTYQAGYDFRNRALMIGLTKEVYSW